MVSEVLVEFVPPFCDEVKVKACLCTLEVHHGLPLATIKMSLNEWHHLSSAQIHKIA